MAASKQRLMSEYKALEKEKWVNIEVYYPCQTLLSVSILTILGSSMKVLSSSGQLA